MGHGRGHNAAIATFVALAGVGLFNPCSAIELTFWLDPAGNECFFEDVYKGDSISGNYQVTSGGDLKVGFTIADPNGRVMLTTDSGIEEMFELEAEDSGEFSFCFSNRHSYNDMKSVTFELNTDHNVVDDVVDKGAMTELQGKIRELQNLIRDVHSTQRYLRNREIRHKKTTDSTHARVVWMSALQSVLIIIFSVIQVFYIRSFFTGKRGMII